MLHAKHVNENMSNMSRHVSIPWLKSGLKTNKNRPKKCHAPISHDKHVNENISNMSCHVSLTLMCGHVHSPTYVPCQRPVSLLLCKVNMSNSITIGKQILAGVKGRVRSNLIYIEKQDSCRVQRSTRALPTHPRVSAIV